MSKKSKPQPKNVISVGDRAQIEEIYKVKPYIANGVYLTPLMQAKSTTVRITFTESNFTLGKQLAVNAVSMTIEDVQAMYNALTTLLQQMRQMGRIE